MDDFAQILEKCRGIYAGQRPDDFDPAPSSAKFARKPSRDDDVDEAPRKKKKKKAGDKSSKTPLYVGLGCGVLLLGACCIGGSVGAFVLFGTSGGTPLTIPCEEKVTLSKNGPLRENPVPHLVTGRVPYKTFKVELKAGKNYVIDLVNPTYNRKEGLPLKAVLDPYLIVEDKNGQKLIWDDDSGGYPNARILFRPPSDGEYRIICTLSFPNVSGDILLKVREQ